MNAWNKAHSTDEGLKGSFASESLHAAVVSDLFLSSALSTSIKHRTRKFTFPSPCICDVAGTDEEVGGAVDGGDVAMEEDTAVEGEPALLSSPLSPATAAAIAARIESHSQLYPKERRLLLFALRTANTDTSKEHRSTPVNAHAWTGQALAKLWSASHTGDAVWGTHAATALQKGVHTRLFCSTSSGGTPGRRAFAFPNPRFSGGEVAAGDSEKEALHNAAAAARVAGASGGVDAAPLRSAPRPPAAAAAAHVAARPSLPAKQLLRLRRAADKKYVGGASAVLDLRDEEAEAEEEAGAKDGGAAGEDDVSLLSRPLTAATAARLAERISACSSLMAKQRRVLLFALRTANTDAAGGHSPLNPHAWNSTTLTNAWNKAHVAGEQLQRKSNYAKTALRAAVTSGLFLSDAPGMSSGHKLTFPNPCACDVGGADEEVVGAVNGRDDVVEEDRADEGESALLSSPLSPATAAAIAARIKSHPRLQPKARRLLLFALRW